MKRSVDLFLSILLLIVLAPVLVVIALMIKLTTSGSVFYWSERVGYNNKIFSMPKFRSMIIATPLLPSNSLDAPERYFTPLGSFLRRTSLDELPQLFCVLSGRMSLVGPRPVLSCETDLVNSRTQYGIHKLRPGITGWAQVNGRDNLSIAQKVQYDYEYLIKKSIKFDLKIIGLTISKVLKQQDVTY